MSYVLVAMGGGLGAALRYGSVQAATRALGHSFPYGTLIVNVVGSFCMGAFVVWLASRSSGDAALRLLFATGLLGGFTTFSAFSLDALTLYERGAYGATAAYVLLSVGISLAAIAVGMWGARSLLS
ncbi:MAG: fluoride efflux transporter CrcB [Pseudomonadota bacterium]